MQVSFFLHLYYTAMMMRVLLHNKETATPRISFDGQHCVLFLYS